MNASGAPPASATSLREANSARVVDAVKRYGQITQVELAAATGLSPATISNIVKSLLSQGVVETQNTVRSGRRAQLVTLAHATELAVGIHVAPRSMNLMISGATQESGSALSMPLPFDHRADTTLDRAAMLVMELTDEMGIEIRDLMGIGIAIPAPINPKTGQIAIRGIMPGWEDLDIRDTLSRRLGLPVLVENDANAGAVGEGRYGALRGVSSGIYLRISHQTGGGFLIDGEVFRGPHGTAGEFGHVQVQPMGQICVCGARGCLNTVVGANSLINLLPPSRGPMSLGDLISSAKDGDPGSRQVLADAGTTIGTAMANTALWADPEVIVVGGELADAGDILLAPMADALHTRPMLAAGGVTVVRSELEGRAEPLGALALAMDAFSHPFSTQEAQ